MDISENEYKIVFTNDCRMEMDYIYSYITNNLYNQNAARRLMKRVENTVMDLKDMPESYPIIKKYDGLDFEYRKIVINNYVVIYTVSKTEKIIYIVHMYYGGSNYLTKI